MLYVTPTPLGNLEDITARAIKHLSACDFIIAENPNHTIKLLNLLNLPKKPVVQFADYNETKVLSSLVDRLKNETACLVSDAGMPGIADPGFRLVRACREDGLEVVVLPGPSAAVTALVGSGLPTDKFLFVGFLPKTEPKLIKILEECQKGEATLVCYESPQRITKTIKFIQKFSPSCKVAVARELSKIHEEYITGNPEQTLTVLEEKPTIKGEITLIISFK